MDIASIRKDPDLYKDNQKKRFADPNVIDKILEIDTIWKSYLHKNERLKALKNRLDRCFKDASNDSSNLKLCWDEHIYTLENLIDDLMNGVPEKDPSLLIKDQLKIIVGYIKDITKMNDKIQDDLLKKRDELIMTLGNILNPYVVISDDEKDNPVVETVVHSVNDYKTNLQTHIDLLDKWGFVDTTSGIKISGERAYFLTGFGVKLNIALMKYATDFLAKKGYTLMETPHFLNADMMGKIAQLSDYDDTLYKLHHEPDDNNIKYLIATSEQPLTAYFSNMVINKQDLPIKYGGISSCYRKEIGAHGRNTRGIFRVHQFTKVEQFCVTTPENSWTMFNSMMDIVKEFYNSLGISYRIVNIVSGALNNAASMKHDLEAFFPGSNTYYELVSCTNCLDFFSRRIRTKYNNNNMDFVHMLNCTLCANTRTICCLAETYQTAEGMIIPPVLRPYLDGIEFIKFK